MFSPLRLRLTALYLLVGMAFLALVAVGAVRLLRGYFRSTTDLALQHRLAQELRALGDPVPPAIAAAEQSWYAASGRPFIAQPLAPPTAVASASSGDDEGGEEGERRGEGSDSNEASDDEAFDAELAAIFVQTFNANGESTTLPGTALLTSADAEAAAAAAGIDWRTVVSSSGIPVRLLSYRVDGASREVSVVQLGRALADQERTLHQLVLVLLGLGAVGALLLGVGGWWLAGRSLEPAEEAWRRQNTFVANASHELRTPLTLIRASAEVLQRETASRADVPTDLVDDILSECDHMGRLVSDLLLLSRLDSGRLDLDVQPVDVEALFDDLARQFGRVASEKGVRLVVRPPADMAPLMVRADPTRLRQVLLVLMDNALRHTPAGGEIRLWADFAGRRGPARESDVAIQVADTGAGIAAADLDHVFERFYRGASDAGQPGSGLGLAVAQALVEAHGGTIRIASTAGSGTTVTIMMPRAAAGTAELRRS